MKTKIKKQVVSVTIKFDMDLNVYDGYTTPEELIHAMISGEADWPATPKAKGFFPEIKFKDK